MADIPLENDKVYTIPVVYRDQSGGIVPMPAGDVASVATGGPHAASLGVAMTALPSGQAAVTAQPLVAESDAGNGGGGISVTLTDTAGLPMQQTYSFSIVQNLTPADIDLDTANMTTVPQGVPPATGP